MKPILMFIFEFYRRFPRRSEACKWRRARGAGVYAQVGWSKGSLISRLEEKRKARSLKYYKRKREEARVAAAAMKEATSALPQEQQQLLQQCGYA